MQNKIGTDRGSTIWVWHEEKAAESGTDRRLKLGAHASCSQKTMETSNTRIRIHQGSVEKESSTQLLRVGLIDSWVMGIKKRSRKATH